MAILISALSGEEKIEAPLPSSRQICTPNARHRRALPIERVDVGEALRFAGMTQRILLSSSDLSVRVELGPAVRRGDGAKIKMGPRFRGDDGVYLEPSVVFKVVSRGDGINVVVARHLAGAEWRAKIKMGPRVRGDDDRLS